MPTACSSAATACASKRRCKPSPLDRAQPLMERSHPSSGRSATPADISRNGRPTSIGTGGRYQSECPADIIGIRTVYHMLRDGTFYHDLGAGHFCCISPEPQANRLAKLIAKLGFTCTLAPIQPHSSVS